MLVVFYLGDSYAALDACTVQCITVEYSPVHNISLISFRDRRRTQVWMLTRDDDIIELRKDSERECVKSFVMSIKRYTYPDQHNLAGLVFMYISVGASTA